MIDSGILHETVRACPLCRSKRSHIIMHLNYAAFDDCPIVPDFPWVICSECGFSYYDTPATVEMFEKYYLGNAYYFTSVTAGSGGYGKYEQKRFGAIAELIEKYLPAES